jgi:3-keto-L-gulonate-6-phosphate decarboxylase
MAQDRDACHRWRWFASQRDRSEAIVDARIHDVGKLGAKSVAQPDADIKPVIGLPPASTQENLLLGQLLGR